MTDSPDFTNSYQHGRVNRLISLVYSQAHFLMMPCAPIPFVYHLHKLSMLYHFDDPLSEIHFRNGYSPSPYIAGIMDEIVVPRMKELASRPLFQQLTGYDDLFDVAMTVCSSSPYYTGREFVPKWGFSFDETPDNSILAYTRPDRWNGWGVPLVEEHALRRLCYELCYPLTFDLDTRSAKVITHDEPVTLPLHLFSTSEGQKFLYDLGGLGLCFNIDDCQEEDKGFWEGFV